MVSLFYSETGEIFLKMSLERPHLCFLVIWFFSVVDALMLWCFDEQTYRNTKYRCSPWVKLCTAGCISSTKSFIYLSLTLFYLLISHLLTSHLGYLLIQLSGNCASEKWGYTLTSGDVSELLIFSCWLGLGLKVLSLEQNKMNWHPVKCQYWFDCLSSDHENLGLCLSRFVL